MSSLYEELQHKIDENPERKRNVSRFDLTLLLFNARADLNELWLAADDALASEDADSEAVRRLHAAVDTLRPIFGERK